MKKYIFLALAIGIFTVVFINISQHLIENQVKTNDHEEQRFQAQQSKEAIISSYNQEFAQLKKEAEHEQNQLFEVAYQDYQNKTKSGEAISYAYFYRTYYVKAKSIEEEMDARFDEKYHAFVEHLTANGYDTEAADSAKESYEKAKNDLYNQLSKKLY
ncbi:hypothetical protein [Evansella halocellulosilytica]|uniref:hypothetical protein n=1 Tax=Evansella halocellulosilytica TaxID=2011013 RepID=UPI000BB679CF|nr:hypothetical protein [Evansella halocellulosilytica]